MSNRNLLCSLSLILLLLLPPTLKAALLVSPGTTSFNLSHDVSVLRDAPADLTIATVNTPFWQSRFVKPRVSGLALNLAQVSGPIWLRIELQVSEGVSPDWILDIPYGHLRDIEWFIPNATGIGFVPASDMALPLSNYRYHAQPVTLQPGTVSIYVRIVTDVSLTLPLQLQTESAFLTQEANHLFAQALYFGSLAALFLYALLFAWSVKDTTYLIFSAYLLTTGFAIFVGNGLARLFLWPQLMLPELAIQSISFALSGAFSLWLTGSFLRETNLSRWLAKLLHWFAWTYLALAILIAVSVLFDFGVAMLDGLFAAFTLSSAVVVLIGLWVARVGKRSEIYFVAAWIVVWIGALVASARSMDWVSSNLPTLYVMQVATGVAALLFSVALFVRVRQQFQARILAQQQALDARAALIEGLQESERKLEATVTQRTAQLQASLDAEKRLREQYVRFGAMISHEFRNPLGVIETQTALLQRELKAGIDNSGKRIGTVRSAAQRLALLFEKWLQSDRLQNATDKLHTQPIEFDDWFADLVAKCHAYHANHRIDCSLNARIGVVHADERLLQIAVLNLIDNACKYSPAGTTVSVSASLEGANLQIEVADEGVGISPELHAKVFDEYFRVDPDSPVLGVGLGLPFVRKIATLHGGSVTASDNPVGYGARFRIVLPIKPR